MDLYHFCSTAVPGRKPYLIVKPIESLNTQQHASHFLRYKKVTMPQHSRNLDCNHKLVPITSHRHVQWLLPWDATHYLEEDSEMEIVAIYQC